MATANLTTSPTTIAAATDGVVWVTNTGTTRVTVVNGSQTTYVRRGRSTNIVPTAAVTAKVLASDGGSGSITYEVTPVNTDADLVRANEMDLTAGGASLAAAAAFTGTYARKLSRRALAGGWPLAMTTAPAVTLGGANAASAIASAKLWDPGCGAFTYAGSDMAYGQTFPDTLSYTPAANAGTNNTIGALVTPPWRLSFYTDAPQFEVYTKAVTTAYRVMVDGQFVTAGGGATVTRASSGNGHRDLFDFTSAGGRRIRLVEIDFPPSGRLYGIVTGPTDTVVPGPRKRRIAVVGDSFTEGTGAASAFLSWAYSLAMLLGGEPWCSGLGATGYLNPSISPKVKFRDRLTNDVLRYAPDVIVWAGGINDHGSYSASAVAAEATLCWSQARAACPDAVQVVVGPFWRNGPSTMPVSLLDCKDALAAAAASAGVLWVDPLEMIPAPPAFSTTLAAPASLAATSISTAGRPSLGNNGASMVVEIGTGSTRERQLITAWTGGGPYTASTKALSFAHGAGETVRVVGASHWTGTGRSGATAGDGNSDVLVGGTDGSDPTHPTPAGHDALARTVCGQILAALPV